MKTRNGLLWLGGPLLGAALLTGCQHYNRITQRSSPRLAGPVVTSSSPVTPYSPGEVAGSVPPRPAVVPAALPPSSGSYYVQPAAASTPDPRPIGDGADYKVTGGSEPDVPRRSYGDITVRPGFAHAPDYSWVTGELDYLHSRH